MRAALTIVLSVAVQLGGLLLPTPAFAGTLDQATPHLSDVDAVDFTGSSMLVAQTFVAGRSGYLDQIDLHAWVRGVNGALIVQIRDVVGGKPGDTILGSLRVVLLSPHVADSSTDDDLTWLSFPLTSPARVEAGTPYAMVIAPEGGIGFNWNYSGGNPPDYEGYLSGDGFVQIGGNWIDLPTAQVAPNGPAPLKDFAFRTFVAPLGASGRCPGPGLGYRLETVGSNQTYQDADRNRNGYVCVKGRAATDDLL